MLLGVSSLTEYIYRVDVPYNENISRADIYL